MKKLFNYLFIFLLIAVSAEGSAKKVERNPILEWGKSLYLGGKSFFADKDRMKKTAKYLSIPVLAVVAIEAYLQLKHEQSLFGFRKPKQRSLVEAFIPVSSVGREEDELGDFKNNLPNTSKVVDRVSIIKVLQQGQVDCAYHALKNVICVMNSFQGGSPIDVTSKLVYNDFFKKWGNFILAEREPKRAAQKDMIDNLEKELTKSRTIKASRLKEGMVKDCEKDKGCKAKIEKIRDELSAKKIPNGSGSLNGSEIESVIKTFGINKNLNIKVCDDKYSADIAVKEIKQSQKGLWGVIWLDTEHSHWVGFVVYKVGGNQDIYFMNSRKNEYSEGAKEFVSLIS